jgi:hypothetical protein
MLKCSFTRTKPRRYKGVGGQRQSLADLARDGDPVPMLQVTRWTLGSIWTDAENIANIGILIHDLHPSPDIIG